MDLVSPTCICTKQAHRHHQAEGRQAALEPIRRHACALNVRRGRAHQDWLYSGAGGGPPVRRVAVSDPRCDHLQPPPLAHAYTARTRAPSRSLHSNGAIGDNKTDSTAAVIATIAGCTKAHPSGAVVHFPGPGTYRYSSCALSLSPPPPLSLSSHSLCALRCYARSFLFLSLKLRQQF